MFYHHKTCRGLWQALWPPDAKSWLIGKDPDAGEDWWQQEKVMAEDEMVGWHHWLNGHEFEQTLEDSVGPGSLVYCCPWGPRVWHDLAAEQEQQKGGGMLIFAEESVDPIKTR